MRKLTGGSGPFAADWSYDIAMHPARLFHQTDDAALAALVAERGLALVIGVVDGFNQARMIASNAFNLSAVTIVAILFVLITIPQARFVDRLVERDQARMRAAS